MKGSALVKKTNKPSAKKAALKNKNTEAKAKPTLAKPTGPAKVKAQSCVTEPAPAPSIGNTATPTMAARAKAPPVPQRPLPPHQQFLSKGPKPQAVMKARIIRHQGR
jgi:hypothetical protein